MLYEENKSQLINIKYKMKYNTLASLIFINSMNIILISYINTHHYLIKDVKLHKNFNDI